ncbi:MAG: hypothetical protein ACOY5R_10805 [Pseudomonadota bacterium]
MINLFLCFALIAIALMAVLPLAIPAFVALALAALRPPAVRFGPPEPRSIFDTRRMGLA